MLARCNRLASAIDGCQVESKGGVGVELMVNEAAFFEEAHAGCAC